MYMYGIIRHLFVDNIKLCTIHRESTTLMQYIDSFKFQIVSSCFNAGETVMHIITCIHLNKILLYKILVCVHICIKRCGFVCFNMSHTFQRNMIFAKICSTDFQLKTFVSFTNFRSKVKNFHVII